MARIVMSATGAEALTFDDVLLQPGHSEVMPGQTNIATRIARDIDLSLPILSSAMDTVTESRLAIAMAQAGGIGVIHRNLTPIEQAEEVRQVKKFESGMVVNPVTIGPDATLAEAQVADGRRMVSPVFRWSSRRAQAVTGRLVGILTNRDVRFASDPESEGLRVDDAREPRDGQGRRRSVRRPSGCLHSAPDRKAACHRRCRSLCWADHRQGY